MMRLEWLKLGTDRFVSEISGCHQTIRRPAGSALALSLPEVAALSVYSTFFFFFFFPVGGAGGLGLRRVVFGTQSLSLASSSIAATS